MHTLLLRALEGTENRVFARVTEGRSYTSNVQNTCRPQMRLYVIEGKLASRAARPLVGLDVFPIRVVVHIAHTSPFSRTNAGLNSCNAIQPAEHCSSGLVVSKSTYPRCFYASYPEFVQV